MSSSEEALRFARQLIAFPHSDGNLTAASIIQVLVAERDAALKKITDAPHDTFFCATWTGPQDSKCTCWKSKL